MITIKKSQTADTRTATAPVSKETLLGSSRQHIDDVSKAIEWMRDRLEKRGASHDWTKIDGIDEFQETIENRIMAIKQFDNDDADLFEAEILYYENILNFSEALAKAKDKDAMRRVLNAYIERIEFREDGMYQIKLNHTLLKSSTKESIWWA